MCSRADGHLGCSQSGAFAAEAAVERVRVFVGMFSLLLNEYQGVEPLSHGVAVFNFLRNHKPFPKQSHCLHVGGGAGASWLLCPRPGPEHRSPSISPSSCSVVPPGVPLAAAAAQPLSGAPLPPHIFSGEASAE